MTNNYKPHKGVFYSQAEVDEMIAKVKKTLHDEYAMAVLPGLIVAKFSDLRTREDKVIAAFDYATIAMKCREAAKC